MSSLFRFAAQRTARTVHDLDDAAHEPGKNYPPISSIPHTPESRLRAPPTTPASVLYLAFGSNLCAETLLGVRGLRPISRVSVSVPTLDLTFDLPGMPYMEPCFANTAVRKVPELPDPTHPPKTPKVPPFDPPYSTTANSNEDEGVKGDEEAEKDPLGRPKEKEWTKGLVGVVYEITHEDYNTVVATEGGGSSYQEIVVPCFPLPPRMSVPERPPIDLPKPFFARTLFAPSLPGDLPSDPGKPEGAHVVVHHEDGTEGFDEMESNPIKDPHQNKWYWRFLQRPMRKDPSYAQPSARYLKLLTDGAREHELPEDYQAYLQSLHSYQITSFRQRLGIVAMLPLILPMGFVALVLGKRFADDRGKYPLWLAVTSGFLFKCIWTSYDWVMKPLFGDGERTEGDEKPKSKAAGWNVKRWMGYPCAGDEEKASLLNNPR